MHRLLRLPADETSPERLRTLESILHIGAPCSPSLKREFITWMGARRVVEVYAGSESNGLTMIRGDDWLTHPGSVGRPIGGTELLIRSPDGKVLPPATDGLVWMRRGAQPAYSYLGAMSRRDDEGWDTLGDVGHLDPEGYLYLVPIAPMTSSIGAATRCIRSRLNASSSSDPASPQRGRLRSPGPRAGRAHRGRHRCGWSGPGPRVNARLGPQPARIPCTSGTAHRAHAGPRRRRQDLSSRLGAAGMAVGSTARSMSQVRFRHSFHQDRHEISDRAPGETLVGASYRVLDHVRRNGRKRRRQSNGDFGDRPGFVFMRQHQAMLPLQGTRSQPFGQTRTKVSR